MPSIPLEPLYLALLSAAAFAAGLVDAIAGGGGLLTLPALLVTGLPPEIALGTNKGQAVFGSFAATSTFWRHGAIDRPRAPLAFGCGLCGSMGGALTVLAVPSAVLKPVILVLLVCVAASLALRRDFGTTARRVPTGRPRTALAVIATAIGFYDGLFGPGTGTFLIMAFVMVLGDTMMQASANAKVVNFASNIAAFGVFAVRGVVRWDIALPMAVAQILGSMVGARLAVKRGDRFVRAVVLVVVVAVALKLAWDLVES